MDSGLPALALAALVAIAAAATAGAPDRVTSADAPASAASPARSPQTTCPVMTGNAIDPSIFSIYQGKRVYFCCTKCKAAFDEAPEKYLARLPQFASAEGGHAADDETGAAQLIEPLGIVTLTLLLLTAGAGLFRRLKPRLLLRCHKVVALLAVLSALAHATLVLVLR